MAFFLYHLVCISLVRIYYVEAFDRSSIEREINFINSVQSSWKAGYNPMSEVDPEAWKKLLGVKFNPKEPSMTKTLSKHKSPSIYSDTDFPTNFDPREAWPACNDLISFIGNQGNCESSWAIAAASAFSDRLCIASNGTFNLPLSAQDILTCCKDCTDDRGDVCNGAFIEKVVTYLQEEGIVTGGDERSSDPTKLGCLPYSKSSFEGNGGQCERKCSNDRYEIPYSEDKHHIKQFYEPDDENEIKKELMRGSCYVVFDVYADFVYYSSGIYSPTTDGIVGLHAMRLLGWGAAQDQEDGPKRGYRLLANSWGASWGENGTIKMERKSGPFFGKQTYCVEPLMNA